MSTDRQDHKVRTYKEYHSVCPSSELGLSQPLSRQRVFPSPQKQGGGGTLACGRGVGGESQFRRGAYTVVLFICTYFVGRTQRHGGEEYRHDRLKQQACTVLHCSVLYCTILYCTVLCCTVLFCTVRTDEKESVERFSPKIDGFTGQSTHFGDRGQSPSSGGLGRSLKPDPKKKFLCSE